MEQKIRILAVDDNLPTLKILKREFNAYTGQVYTAQSGEEALLMLQREEIDILVTDLNMPQMNGIELITYAKEYQPDLQCIILTAYGDKEHIVKALKLGALDYLEKPCKPGELQTAMEKAIQQLETRRQLQHTLDKESSKIDLILNAVGEGILGLDIKGRIIFINNAAKRLLGRPHDQLIGKKFHSLAHHTGPYGQDINGDECPVCAAHRQEQAIHGDKQLFWRKDGSSFPVAYISTPMRRNGEAVGTLLSFTDISNEKKITRQLSEKEHFLETLLNSMQCGVVLIDSESHVIVEANPMAIQMIDAPRERIIGQVCHKFICTAEEGNCPITDLGEEVNVSERLLVSIDNRNIPILKTVTPVILQGRHYLLETFIDISYAKQLEEELEASYEVFHSIVDRSLDGVVIFDKDGLMQFANDAALSIFGRTKEELLGKIFEFPITTKKATELDITTPQGKKTVVEMRVANTAWEGEKAYVATLRDITFRKQMEDRIKFLAIHDPLTGLPNSNLLLDRLEQMIKLAKRDHRKVAVVYVDLDNFTAANTSLGRDGGDIILKETAERLRDMVRASDTVARICEDKFALSLLNITDPADLKTMSLRMLELLIAPFIVEGMECILGASIGISLYPDDSEDPAELVELAEEAKNQVKKQGKNGFEFYQNIKTPPPSPAAA